LPFKATHGNTKTNFRPILKAFLISPNGPLLCEGFRARQGLAQHLPHNRKTSFAFDCITPLAGLHLQML
jgi:hypothetical protein